MIIEIGNNKLTVHFAAGQIVPRYLAVIRADKALDTREPRAVAACDVQVEFVGLEPLTSYNIIAYNEDIFNPLWQTQVRTCARPEDRLRLALTGPGVAKIPVEMRRAPWNNKIEQKWFDEFNPTNRPALQAAIDCIRNMPSTGINETYVFDEKCSPTGLSLGGAPQTPEPAKPDPSVWNTPITMSAWQTARDADAADNWRQKYEYFTLRNFGGWTTQQLDDEMRALGQQGWLAWHKDDKEICFWREAD